MGIFPITFRRKLMTEIKLKLTFYVYKTLRQCEGGFWIRKSWFTISSHGMNMYSVCRFEYAVHDHWGLTYSDFGGIVSSITDTLSFLAKWLDTNKTEAVHSVYGQCGTSGRWGAALLLLSTNKLIKMCQRTGSHFHDWIDYHRLNILGIRKFQLVEIKKWEDYSQEVLWLAKEYNIMGKGFLRNSSTYPA